MKKVLLVLLCSVCAVSALFAEEPVPEGDRFLEITVDMVKDAVYSRMNTGEFGEAAAYGTEGRTYNYIGDDALTVFNMKNEMFDNSNLYLKFGYATENVGGLIRLALNSRSFDDDTVLSISNLVDVYYAWGKIGYFKLWAGRDDYRGVIDRYQNFDDFVTSKNDGFGPIIASYDYRDSRTLSLAGSDITNLGKDVQGFARTTMIGEFTFDPVTVSLAANNLYSAINGRGTNESSFIDNFTDYDSTFGARIEAAKLFDVFSIAGVYKYQTSDRKYEDEEFQLAKGQQSFFLPEMGQSHHQFGAFINLAFENAGFGLSAGYSGYAKLHRELEAPSYGGWTSYEYPFWHGVDFRLNFTGIENLSITLNNNLSFSSVKGDDDEKSFIYGFYENYRGDPDVEFNQEQGVFVLYNALALAYRLDGGVTIKLEAANQYARLKNTYNEDETRFIDTLNSLSVYLGAGWQITPMLAVRGGVDVRFNQYSHEDIDLTSNAGIFEWGIPIGLTVRF